MADLPSGQLGGVQLSLLFVPGGSFIPQVGELPDSLYHVVLAGPGAAVGPTADYLTRVFPGQTLTYPSTATKVIQVRYILPVPLQLSLKPWYFIGEFAYA